MNGVAHRARQGDAVSVGQHQRGGDQVDLAVVCALFADPQVTAQASAIGAALDAFRARHAGVVEQVETAREDVEFKVPRIFREKVA